MTKTQYHLCDLCGEETTLLQSDQYYVDLPDVDLKHTAHQETVDTDTGAKLDICYDCTPHVSDWLSSSCSLCESRVTDVITFQHSGRADFQFFACIECSGWERREQ